MSFARSNWVLTFAPLEAALARLVARNRSILQSLAAEASPRFRRARRIRDRARARGATRALRVAAHIRARLVDLEPDRAGRVTLDPESFADVVVWIYTLGRLTHDHILDRWLARREARRQRGLLAHNAARQKLTPEELLARVARARRQNATLGYRALARIVDPKHWESLRKKIATLERKRRGST